MSSKTSHSFKEVFGVLNAIQQELFILRNNKSPETKTIACQTEESGPVASSSSSWTEVSSADIRSSTPSPKVSAGGQPPIVKKPSPSSFKTTLPAKAPRRKVNVCFVGDSIAHSVDTVAVEKATGAIITKSKAYGSKKDYMSLYPDRNFTDVVKGELARKFNQTGLDYDVLVLQASSTDITNLDTADKKEDSIVNMKKKL